MPFQGPPTKAQADELNRLLGRWHAALEVVNRHAAAIKQITSGVPTAATLQAARDRQQLYRAARAKAQAVEAHIRRTYTQITGDVAESPALCAKPGAFVMSKKTAWSVSIVLHAYDPKNGIRTADLGTIYAKDRADLIDKELQLNARIQSALIADEGPKRGSSKGVQEQSLFYITHTTFAGRIGSMNITHIPIDRDQFRIDATWAQSIMKALGSTNH